MKSFIGMLAAGFGLVMLAGCGVSKSDDDLIREVVLNSEYFGTRTIEGSASKAGALPEYLTWWRQPTSNPDPYLEIDRVDDSAFVVFSGKSAGIFHVVDFDPDSSFTKDYVDSATIKGVVMKVDEGQWQLTDVSGVHAISCENPPGFSIDSVRISMGGVDTVFTDPTELFDIADVMSVSKSSMDTVKCWVYTGSKQLDGALHLFGRRDPGETEHHRIDFSPSADTSYYYAEKAGQALAYTGLHFIGIDLFPLSTLTEKNSPYQCRIWMIPFEVTD